MSIVELQCSLIVGVAITIIINLFTVTLFTCKLILNITVNMINLLFEPIRIIEGSDYQILD